jgi:protein-L-isoaspartate(D-aspartate) O-methyltransferase
LELSSVNALSSALPKLSTKCAEDNLFQWVESGGRADSMDPSDFSAKRQRMVEDQIAARGVRNPLVLDAMRRVPREKFVAKGLEQDAYRDTPLPIVGGQTISQPYIVGFMVEALDLRGGENILEIGAGSGYAAAVLAEIAEKVYTVERIGQLAEHAAQALQKAGYTNVHIKHADGTEGWVDVGPFDAILVSAGAPSIPKSLMAQLKIGGHLVVPVGRNRRAQELVRVTRVGESDYDQTDLADVRFVPLIGKEGWEVETEQEAEVSRPRVIAHRPSMPASLPGIVSANAETFDSIESARLQSMLKRIGEKRVVLIGEATHGTHEFYSLRARITRHLIEEKGFTMVAAEADWPDAARINHYVQHRDAPANDWVAFSRFPSWMWRNEETRVFVDWLHNHNLERPASSRVMFCGLDLYSLYTSARAVISYLNDVDPELASVARERYGCLSPWEADPAAYGRAALTGQYRSCEADVSHILIELLDRRLRAHSIDDDRLLDAEQNAQLVAAAEQYYRVMYYGSRASWNLRDQHMFDTLKRVMDFQGPNSKVVIWAHNSHIGNALATEMSARGEFNIGQLCREHFRTASYHIGFGTHFGTVAAASDWDGAMKIFEVRESHPQSYERLFHKTNTPGFLLPLGSHVASDLRRELSKPRLQRAIGVIYRPDTELASHYFEAILPQQFDEYVWIDRTTAIKPIPSAALEGLPATYPFGL